MNTKYVAVIAALAVMLVPTLAKTGNAYATDMKEILNFYDLNGSLFSPTPNKPR